MRGEWDRDFQVRARSRSGGAAAERTWTRRQNCWIDGGADGAAQGPGAAVAGLGVRRKEKSWVASCPGRRWAGAGGVGKARLRFGSNGARPFHGYSEGRERV